MVYKFFYGAIFKNWLANKVYGNWTYYSGVELLIGTFAYTMQIYFDFAGYSNIALGIGRMFGIDLIQNFEQPYLSESIKEFWRKWHISLSTWLKDYVYIPLGGNRKGVLRKELNILITFFISGLWHGASWNFIIWGIIHGIYQIIEDFIKKLVNLLNLNIDFNKSCYRYLKIFVNFQLVNIAWIFFRVNRLSDAFIILKRIIRGFDIGASFGLKRAPDYAWRTVSGMNLMTSVDKSYLNLGLNEENILLLMIAVFIALVVDISIVKKKGIIAWIDEQDIWFRWLVYIIGIFVVLTFGIYGSAYNATGFIYANF